MFWTVVSSRRARAARVAQAMCGVMQQLGAVSNGWSAGGGSTERTSRPAPAIWPARRASASACSSTKRAAARVDQVGRALHHARGARIDEVPGFGRQRAVQAYDVALLEEFVESGRSRDASGSSPPAVLSWARTFMPRARAISAVARPMRPKPTSPIVRSASSISGKSQ